MSEARVVKKVGAPAEAVWAQLGDFTGIEAGGGIDSVSFDGDGVGMTRTIVMGGRAVIERLEAHDSAARTFTYAIINEDSPLPFSDYSATVQIIDDGDDTCTVDWVGRFEPRGMDEAQAVNMATGIYAGAIKRARIALGVDG